jgi:hypothetical protein
VAIVQVSRITQRKGLQEDLPQPLASAELGWAIDERRLFIGNGSLAEGAPVVGNTEILTEFSDILQFTTAYTYQGEAAGYTVQTGASSGTPVSTSLQARLDYYVSVKAFGATGDGTTDDTAAINRALYQLYCVQVNPQIRRGLFFPAGRYLISDTLLVPPYALLYGEGANSSQIWFTAQEWQANTPYDSGVLVKDSSASPPDYYRSLQAVPPTGILLSDTTYWDSITLPAYVVRTTDSEQNTGSNIGSGGAVPPTHIQYQNMSFSTTEYGPTGNHDIMLLERCSEISVAHVDLIGPLTLPDLVDSTEEMSCLRILSSSALPVEMVDFDQCRFTGTTYGINTDNLTYGVNVRSGWFDGLYQGCVIGDSSPENGGPQAFRIMHNTFDNIYAEGIQFEGSSLNLSAYNTFLDVGNHFDSLGGNPSTPVINIVADNCVSVGDMFQRTELDEQTFGQPRVKLWTGTAVPQAIALTNGQLLTLGTYNRHSGLQTTLTDATTATLFTVDGGLGREYGGYSSFRMEYTISRARTGGNTKRRGTFTVVSSIDGDSTGGECTYEDDFVEDESVEVTLSATADTSTGVITVTYVADPTGEDATIYYSLSYLD